MQALDMKDQENYSGKYLKLQKSMYWLSLKEQAPVLELKRVLFLQAPL